MLIAGMAHADWTATIIHPSASAASEARGAYGNKQAGSAWADTKEKAAMWTGTAGTFVDLHPAGAQTSAIYGMTATAQVGYVAMALAASAAIWHGTAAWTNLNPTGASESACLGGYDDKQVGYATLSGSSHAALWTGSAASFIDLNPTGAVTSHAYAGFNDTQVGDADIDGMKAVLWKGTANSFVILHPPGALVSRCKGAGNNVQVGEAMYGTDFHATLWSGSLGSAIDLHPAGKLSSTANAVLGTIQVGEFYKTFSENHACYWTGTADSVVDLQTYLPANYWKSTATAITTDGVKQYISGTAYNLTTQRYEAVVWSRPIPVDFTFVLNKATVAGQNSVQGTITLSPVLPNATTFATYDNSSLVTTPATVTVPANSSVKNFQIMTTAVTSPIVTTIYAKLGTTVRSQPLTLVALVPTALSFTPNPVVGGNATSCKVVINGVAGPGGRTIALFDNSSYATTPSSVIVPAGASSVTFNISTTHPSATQTVTVTARVSAGEKTATLRITP